MSSRKSRTFQTTIAVTLVIFASKAAGLIRDMIVAHYFGTGLENDMYSSAYTLFYIPVLLFNSCVTSTLIPLYVDARNKNGLRAADRFASNCINLFAVFSLVVGLLMMALAEPLTHLIYGGFDPEARALTARLTQIMMPSLIFVVLSIVMASLLNANERYLSAQLTGFPLSVAMIAAAVFFSPRYGVTALAWGVSAAGILQMLILIPSLSKSMRYSMRIRVGDPRIKRMMLLALPAMVSMAANELGHIIDKSMGSFLNTGDLSAMDCAYRLIGFATGVLAVPITTIMFSKLSIHAAEGDRRTMTEVLGQSVETLVMILLPFTVAGCVLSTDIIRLVYESGRFDEGSVAVTSGIFLFYLIGVIGFGLRDMYNRAFHALQDTRTPLVVACASVALHVALNYALAKFLGVNGLALSTTISCALGAVALVILLRHRLKHIGMRGTVREFIKMGAAALACLAASLLLNGVLPGVSGKLMLLVRLTAIAGVAFAVYFGVLFTLKARQLSALKGLVFRRARKA